MNVNISIDSSYFKKMLYRAPFWVAILALIVVWRFFFEQSQSVTDFGTQKATESSRIQPLNTKLYAIKDGAGLTFKVSEPGLIHLRVSESNANNVLINVLNGAIIYSRKDRRNARGSQDFSFEDDIYLKPGIYVLTLVARGGQPAQAEVNISDVPNAR